MATPRECNNTASLANTLTIFFFWRQRVNEAVLRERNNTLTFFFNALNFFFHTRIFFLRQRVNEAMLRERNNTIVEQLQSHIVSLQVHSGAILRNE
jgi:hypothetical protein